MVSVAKMLSLLVKAIFLIAIPMQTMLWPTVSSICFVCIYGTVNILIYFNTPDVGKALMSSGVYLYPPQKKPVNYAFMLIMLCYFAIYFFQFVTQETRLLPFTTLWLDTAWAANYSVQRLADLPVEVTSDASKTMRGAPFEWPRLVQAPAPQVVGTVQGVPCTSGGEGFKCYAKLWAVEDRQTFVPFPREYYDVDVLVKPGASSCASLEVYRMVVDVNLNVVQPLDYPASTIPNSQNRLPVYPPPCRLFNGSVDNLCLKVSHTFTQQQYAQEQAAQCAQYNQQLIFRLPGRSADVDPESGRILLDLLLVSDSAASVTLSAAWKPPQEEAASWFISTTFWKQVIDSDHVQAWRESTHPADVFFKFAIACIPALVCWYYLSKEFLEYISTSQILFLSIFIELPAILLFLSMGAWLPMAGSIVCVLAVNYEDNKKSYWQGFVRPSLLFLKAASNSIQLAWLLALVGQAGWNAFFYELTLRQLYDMSFRFIITDQSSPTWVGIMLPMIILVNLSFLIGSAICVVLECISAKGRAFA
jgi:hypothetical protein